MKLVNLKTADVHGHRYDQHGKLVSTNDTVLNGNFRIDTDTRINAEPAPSAPNLGKLWSGNGTPKEDDVVEAIIKDGHVMTPGAVAKIQAGLANVSGSESQAVNRVGIARIGDSAVRDSLATVKRQTGQLESINERNRAFWDKRNVAYAP